MISKSLHNLVFSDLGDAFDSTPFRVVSPWDSFLCASLPPLVLRGFWYPATGKHWSHKHNVR